MLAAALVSCSDDGDDAAPQVSVSTTEAPGPTQRHDQTRSRAGDGGFGAIPEIVREVEPSVVAVITDTGEGSGVVWAADGLIVTNHHVIASANRITIAFADGTRSSATVVASDPLTDVAVLRADRDDLPPARFAETLPVVGELAIAIGNPLGFENTVTAGIVSGLHRSIPGSGAITQALVDLIQTDAAISPGNSGGALVNARGEVMGINVAYIPPQASAVSIGFAIPAPTVRDVVRQLLEDGTVQHAFFGIVPASLTEQVARQLDINADRGVVVLELVEDGPAAAAGIEPGDVITAIDGEEVETAEDFLALLRARSPGDRITVEILRGDRTMEVTVTLVERPATG